MQLKTGKKTFTAENRTEFIYIVDGLRCLSGMDMVTPEMQLNLRSFTEAHALVQIAKKKPTIPGKPTNFNFVNKTE
jgi:hypothetical protein